MIRDNNINKDIQRQIDLENAFPIHNVPIPNAGRKPKLTDIRSTKST